jgi:hypothetical protein
MNDLKSEFKKSPLYSESTNPDEWFAELICRRLEDDYKCTTFGDNEMLNRIIYNTKPAAYHAS